MTFAAPLLLGTAGTAAAGTVAATAATAGIFGSAGTFSLMSTLSTLSTVGSIFSSIMGGRAEAGAQKMEAAQIELQAKQEETRASQEEALRQRRLREILGTQRAMFAGRGIESTSGTPLSLADVSKGEANRESAIAQSDTAISTIGLRINAASRRAAAKSSLLSGYMGAATTGVNAIMEYKARKRTET